mgnify:CR=1 FL=1
MSKALNWIHNLYIIFRVSDIYIFLELIVTAQTREHRSHSEPKKYIEKYKMIVFKGELKEICTNLNLQLLIFGKGPLNLLFLTLSSLLSTRTLASCQEHCSKSDLQFYSRWTRIWTYRRHHLLHSWYTSVFPVAPGTQQEFELTLAYVCAYVSK